MRSEGLMAFNVGAKRNTERHQTETECRPAQLVARTNVLPTEGDTHEQARSKQGASNADGSADTAQVRTQPLKGVVVGVGIGRGLGSPGSARLEPRTRLMPKRWNFRYIHSIINIFFRIIFSHDILIFHLSYYIVSYTLILVSFGILIGGAKHQKKHIPPKICFNLLVFKEIQDFAMALRRWYYCTTDCQRIFPHNYPKVWYYLLLYLWLQVFLRWQQSSSKIIR